MTQTIKYSTIRKENTTPVAEYPATASRGQDINVYCMNMSKPVDSSQTCTRTTGCM